MSVDMDGLIRWQREAVEILKRCEWASEHQELGYEWCPICGGIKEKYCHGDKPGHAPDCTLAKLLREVGE